MNHKTGEKQQKLGQNRSRKDILLLLDQGEEDNLAEIVSEICLVIREVQLEMLRK